MADVRPFRGVRYDRSLVGDLAAVICPPYDIITPQWQSELYQESEYNFVRVEFNRELPEDTDKDNRYTRAAATLEQWLKQSILKIDKAPAFYLHDHCFTHQGKEYRRRGIIARVRLEKWDKMVVRPHENTMSRPKSDRLSLLWALQANTSTVFALYEDRGKQISTLLAAREQDKPVISLDTGDGEKHEVRAITGAGTINQLCNALANQPLYVADGHHRYESALTYQQERSVSSAVKSADEGYNFVMMTLVDLADSGLVILPFHRLVRDLSRSTIEGLLPKLPPFFEIKELSSGASGAWQQVDDFLGEREDQVRLVLFGLLKKSLFLLKLRDFNTTSPMMPQFHSGIYQRLSVSIVDHVILEGLLGMSHERGDKEMSVDYISDRQDAVNKVLNQEYQLAFLLRPVKARVIKDIADTGDRMPRKTTCFYPKMPSGLVFYRLE